MKTVKMSDMPVIALDVIWRQQIAGVKPIRLTKTEQLALCLLSGVPMSFGATNSNNISKVTTIPIGINWDGEKFRIFYKAGAA